MASITYANTYLNDLKKFYDEHKEKIEKAFNCVTSNPCSEVNSQLESVEEKVNVSLNNANTSWTDSIGNSFIRGLETCISGLNSIESSIETSWTSAEEKYRNNNEKLFGIEETINALNDKITNYPNPESKKYLSTIHNKETGEFYTKTNWILYNSDVKIWKEECDGIIRTGDDLKQGIKANIEALNGINGAGVELETNVAAGITTMEESIKEIYYAPLIQELGLEIFPGDKIEIDDEVNLIKFINMCYREQGSVAGVAFECSQVINNFIRMTKQQPTSVSQLVAFMNTVANKKGSWGEGENKIVWYGWYGADTRKVYDYNSFHLGEDNEKSDIYKEVVTEILNGNRVLPVHVWEHDQIPKINGSGIKYIEIDGNRYSDDGKYNRDNYVKDKTIIVNYEGSKYIFYAFPDEKGDPFGYLADYKKECEERGWI